MALRSRFAISISAGILAAAAAVTPAVADDGGGDWGGGHDQEFTPGRVTASTLLLRSAPNRGSQVIRTVHRGDRVRIFCKTKGQSVQGNRHWYLLADGTWAWGSARYIETRHSPRWC
ncbi:SH3 domain-containing protein [Streptomyces ferrugineus]|uniref:SH3 domain-containing protein n=1 Tax=Streptomyces ferrugineus TaxID=1413221 RepID=A0A7M2SIN3_9ACTN|nr:SH3 domain-containing protein [Streptomyces ferrugineus]QOV35595.1 SH3 domain-containing protein [Streptomyces ferrugineus]